jgi:hypothetical protein
MMLFISNLYYNLYPNPDVCSETAALAREYLETESSVLETFGSWSTALLWLTCRFQHHFLFRAMEDIALLYINQPPGSAEVVIGKKAKRQARGMLVNTLYDEHLNITMNDTDKEKTKNDLYKFFHYYGANPDLSNDNECKEIYRILIKSLYHVSDDLFLDIMIGRKRFTWQKVKYGKWYMAGLKFGGMGLDDVITHSLPERHVV